MGGAPGGAECRRFKLSALFYTTFMLMFHWRQTFFLHVCVCVCAR